MTTLLKTDAPISQPPSRAGEHPAPGSVAASEGGAKAASKLSGATADASQQRSREVNELLRLAAPAGQGGGVTAAAWGSLCDTITTTLCWCLGSLCLLRIPPELLILARSSHSRRPRLWLPPSRPRDVTHQPSRCRYRPSDSTTPAAAAFTSTALEIFFATAFRGAGGGGRDKVAVPVPCGDWGRRCGPRPGEGGSRRWSCEFAAFP